MQNSEVKENAARYLKEIVDILATVDKEMILIFKTLDLLRNISSTLGTQKRYGLKFLRFWLLLKQNLVSRLRMPTITFELYYKTSKKINAEFSDSSID